jgi:hypothetical protein
LPLPFGPTMAVMPSSNTNSVLLANVLYPWRTSFLSLISYKLARILGGMGGAQYSDIWGSRQVTAVPLRIIREIRVQHGW